MIADEQTHTLPADVESVERFARFFGYDSRASFARDLLAHLDCVQTHYGKLFEGDPTGTAKLPEIDNRANEIGFTTIGSSADEFSAKVKRDIEKVNSIAKFAGIVPE